MTAHEALGDRLAGRHGEGTRAYALAWMLQNTICKQPCVRGP